MKENKKLSEEHKRRISNALRGNKNPNYGKPCSVETRQKISEAHKGKKLSEEHKEKLCKALKGNKNPNYGKLRPEEIRLKISQTLKGKRLSEEHKNKISEGMKGKKHPHRGWLFSKETRKKISEAKTGEGNPQYGKKGEKSANWNGGTSALPYPWEFILARSKVRKRDKYICQECEVREKELGRKLAIHHIDYDRNNNDLDNLISLCISCHAKTNFTRENWTQYFYHRLCTFPVAQTL